MAKPVSKRELLQMQIKTYEFYAGLIDRAVGGPYQAGSKLPKWDEQRALEYKQLADELRAQLAALDDEEAAAPAIDAGITKGMESPTAATGAGAPPEP
ncbi:MAG TPA: hypothetical protein VFU88_16055 [Ktedonobacterales bacterium]|nr:hypothetical protein [Ktedonobacterales bacterium]